MNAPRPTAAKDYCGVPQRPVRVTTLWVAARTESTLRRTRPPREEAGGGSEHRVAGAPCALTCGIQRRSRTPARGSAPRCWRSSGARSASSKKRDEHHRERELADTERHAEVGGAGELGDSDAGAEGDGQDCDVAEDAHQRPLSGALTKPLPLALPRCRARLRRSPGLSCTTGNICPFLQRPLH